MKDWFVMGVQLAGVCLLIMCVDSCSDDGNDPVVIHDDGLYINEIYSAGDDWLEIYNAGDIEKNIGGYFIYDDAAKKYTLPANTIITAKGFLALDCDDTGVGLHTNFKLTSDGEEVSLENTSGELLDRVEFPALSDGQSYGRYPDGSTSFAVSGKVTKGSSNGATSAPAIVSVERTPLVPKTTEQTKVEVKLSTSDGVSSVKLYYRLNSGSFTALAMSVNSDHYEANIPAQNSTGTVQYYIEMKTTSGQTTLSPVDAPAEPYTFLLNTDVLPTLFVNEFMASNKTCCPDAENGADEYDDWVEIFNAGSTAVDIGGMYLSDNKNNPFKYLMPADSPLSTTIPAGGHLLLWADGSKSQGVLHLDFSLSATGEDIGIYYKDGRTIDTYTFGTQSDNQSEGRSPDGSSTWKVFTSPTPGSSNN